MFDAVIAMQYIGVIVLFIECWIVFKSWKDSIRAYLFLSCTATLINNLGYLLELKSETLEAYTTALQLSYAGRVWVILGFFLFTMELCKIKLPKLLVRLLVLLQALSYTIVFTFPKHDLYYHDISFALKDGFPVFLHENGIFHQIFMLIQAVYIILGLTALFYTFSKEKTASTKKRLLTVILAFLIESAFFLIQTLNPLKIYDVTMIGSVIGAIFLFISIFRYNLLGTKDIAREFMLDRLSEGVIAVDNEGELQYYNEPARILYPEVTHDPSSVVKAVQEAILKGETMKISSRIYTPQENDLLYNGESFGKLYVLIDSTEYYKRLKDEKTTLRKELLTDPITGFYNRKGMEYYSQKLYKEIEENGDYLFLCVADMNGLKYINDNFGHEHGDRALRELSTIIRESLINGDMAFRTGGDEFLIMGGRKYKTDAVQNFSQRIEKLISEFNEKNTLPYKIGLSYGPLIEEIKGDPDELENLIKISDAKMYEMKKQSDPLRR